MKFSNRRIEHPPITRKTVASFPRIFDWKTADISRYSFTPPRMRSKSFAKRRAIAHHGIRPTEVMQIKTVIVIILSARGSRIFPRRVIKLNFLAIIPSKTSVIPAIAYTHAASVCADGKSEKKNAIKTGTRHILKIESRLGKFIALTSLDLVDFLFYK